MGALKRIGVYIGFLLVLAPCIIAGIYAGNLNTSSTLAGWAVGIGVLIVEVSILALVAGIKDKKDFRWGALGLIVGLIPAGIWIGGPFMTFRPFTAHVSEYFSLPPPQNPAPPPTHPHPLKAKLI